MTEFRAPFFKTEDGKQIMKDVRENSKGWREYNIWVSFVVHGHPLGLVLQDVPRPG